jgi:hypothetical protein
MEELNARSGGRSVRYFAALLARVPPYQWRTKRSGCQHDQQRPYYRPEREVCALGEGYVISIAYKEQVRDTDSVLEQHQAK